MTGQVRPPDNAPPVPAAAAAALPPRPMITPEKQLRLLALPTVQERLHRTRFFDRICDHEEVDKAIAFAAKSILELPVSANEVLPEQRQTFHPVLNTVIESVTRSILKPVTNEESETQVPLLTDIVIESQVDPSPLPSILTHWYTALKRINALPDHIPALSRSICQILRNQCPIYRDKRIGETHSLYLIPPGTLNQLEERVRAYGQTLYPNENPLKFRSFWTPAREEHANVAFNECQWILISNDVLPESFEQHYREQERIVARLSTKSMTDYEVPTLREAITAIFLHKVATGESLYQAGNGQNGNVYTYTRVQEKTDGFPLTVGGFAPSGLHVHYDPDHKQTFIGVAALRRL